MKLKIAEIISEVFGPHVWMPVLLLALIFRTGQSTDQIVILLPTLFFLLLFIPFFYLHLALKLGWVSHWDLPRKEERRVIFIIFIICSILAFNVVNNVGSVMFRNLFVIFLILGFLVSIITYFWKISIHMILDTLGVLLLNFLLGLKLWPLIVLIPIVGWARYILKRHTFKQILAGFLLASIVFFLGLRYFSYI